MTKYYEFLSGSLELSRDLWLTVGIYSASADEALKQLTEVLIQETVDGSPSGAIFEFVSERELADDEAPTRILYGKNTEHRITWEQSY